MTDKTKNLLDYLNKKEYRQLRNDVDFLLYGDDFGFYRRSPNRIRGSQGNMTPNYKRIIESGFDKIKDQIRAAISSTDDDGKKEYGKSMLTKIDEAIALADTYRDIALGSGNERLCNALSKIPRQPAESFYEACVFLKLCVYMLRDEPSDHIGFGRFDQYMYSYYLSDKAKGVSDEEILETLENFFISINFDTDLYSGVQQGDNGQSMVLGGIDTEGNEVFNLLSELCLLASEELKLIDPKINLRVSRDTPIETFELCTKLTKAGLGFPQYSNDEVVIPALLRLGYEQDDAINYVVAACWEFIIPGVGNDIANIGAVNFPAVIDKTIRQTIPTAKTFKAVLSAMIDNIEEECNKITDNIHDILVAPSPVMDLMRDAKKYNNFGIHGSGIASAADALAAVEKFVFDEKSVSPERLIEALDTNFENDPELFHMLRYEAPKMGQNNAVVNALAGFIMDDFANALNGKKNCLGGKYRAGTGTAMYYLWHAAELGATADGRMAGEPFGTNFSPNLFVKADGPISVINSFTSHNMKRICNGGPLTLEFASSIFNSEDSISKVAALLQYFVDRDGHQLQLNAVNLDTMKKAQENPELYRNLVVRIWGWSAYFVELDREFQDHVIARQEYTV